MNCPRAMLHGMSDTLANIEPVARAICARELGVRNDAADVPSLVDRYWRVTAALLEAGLIDDSGETAPHSFEEGEDAWADWLALHRYPSVPSHS